MTRRRVLPIFAVIVTLALSVQAAAQPLAVRSGEHDGFTRLVVPLPGGTDWRVTGEARTRRVRFTPSVPTFDLREVFQRATRDRLSDIRQDDGLVLELACDCLLTAERYRDGFLVIDIADAPPAPATASAAPALPNPFGRQPAWFDLAPRPAPGPLDGAPPLSMRPVSVSGPDIQPSAAPAEGAGMAPSPEAVPDSGAPAAADLQVAAEMLAEQLARAAAAGLLDAAPMQPIEIADPLPRRPIATGDTEDTRDVEGTVGPEATQPSVARLSANLPVRAENAFDVVRQNDGFAAPARDRLSCDPDAGLQLGDWSSGLGFEQDIGRLRARLYDARDRLVAREVVALARHYIYYGFGAEAEYWLSRLPVPPPREMAMARLLDDVAGPNFPPVDSLETCSESESLWRYVDAPVPPEITDEQRGGILLAFAALPSDLRRIVGPRLARQLDAGGHAAAAWDVREALDRGGQIGAQAELLMALSAGQSRADRGTLRLLEDILRTDAANAPEAMVQYLAMHRRLGSTPEEVYVTAAEAILRETGGAPEPGGLWHEVMLAHAGAGRIGPIISMLDEVGDRSPATRGSILAPLMEVLAARDRPAVTILVAVHIGTDWDLRALPGPARIALSATFAEAGLDSLARAYAPAVRLSPAARAARPRVEAPERAAWRAGDWARMQDLSTGPHSEAAGRMARLAESAPSELPATIEEYRASVAESRDTRALVARLLASPAPEPSGN